MSEYTTATLRLHSMPGPVVDQGVPYRYDTAWQALRSTLGMAAVEGSVRGNKDGTRRVENKRVLSQCMTEADPERPVTNACQAVVIVSPPDASGQDEIRNQVLTTEN